MPTGVICDCLFVLAGALFGCLIGNAIPPKLRDDLNVLLGFCSMSIGITSIVKVSAMAPVIIAVMLGYAIGFLLKFEDHLKAFCGNSLARLPLPKAEGFNMDHYITVVVLFCASGFGIYATFVEALSGNSSILYSKSFLDFVTAMTFAVTLRYAVAVIPVPMAAILLLLFGVGKLIAPIVTETMLMNFMACGGILTLAAGLRVSGIKSIAITNLIPALVLVMPLTCLWELLPL